MENAARGENATLIARSIKGGFENFGLIGVTLRSHLKSNDTGINGTAQVFLRHPVERSLNRNFAVSQLGRASHRL